MKVYGIYKNYRDMVYIKGDATIYGSGGVNANYIYKLILDKNKYEDYLENLKIAKIQTPMISAPEGKVFAGWALESIDENGVKTLTIVFGPTENGVVTLPAGTVLEPMTLFAHFENA